MQYPSNEQDAYKHNPFVRRIHIPLWIFVVALAFCFVLGIVLAGPANGEGWSNGGSAMHTNNVPGSQLTYTSVPTRTAKPLVWTTTYQFSGNGASQTATFQVSKNEWKLLWNCTPASFYGDQYNVVIDVDIPGQDLPVDASAINTICANGNQSGYTEEYATGTFYLGIDSEAKWRIQVQEQK